MEHNFLTVAEIAEDLKVNQQTFATGLIEASCPPSGSGRAGSG
jgi:hypothetical protein